MFRVARDTSLKMTVHNQVALGRCLRGGRPGNGCGGPFASGKGLPGTAGGLSQTRHASDPGTQLATYDRIDLDSDKTRNSGGRDSDFKLERRSGLGAPPPQMIRPGLFNRRRDPGLVCYASKSLFDSRKRPSPFRIVIPGLAGNSWSGCEGHRGT